MGLTLMQTELKEANEFVAKFHRHHKPVQGHRFSVGASNDGGTTRCGVAIIGRPVSRGCPPNTTLEVTRLCTDGTHNACSFLYSAAARAGKALGYKKIQTYILEGEEHGTSLLASGWIKVAVTKGGEWSGTNGKPRRKDQPTGPKSRWEKLLNAL